MLASRLRIGANVFLRRKVARGSSETTLHQQHACCSTAAAKEEQSGTVEKKKSAKLSIANMNESEIVRVSLSRGLAMDRFDKDFLIYPEFADSDDAKNAQGLAEALRQELEQTVDRAKFVEAGGKLNDLAEQALQRCGLPAVFVPKEYGGLGLPQKALLRLFEELSTDWSVFRNAASANFFAKLVIFTGNEEQRSRLLRQLVSGELRTTATATGDSGLVARVVPSSSGAIQVDVRDEKTRLAPLIVGAGAPHLHAVKCAVEGAEFPSAWLLVSAEGTKDASEIRQLRRLETTALAGATVGRLTISAKIAPENVLSQLADAGGADLRFVSRLALAGGALGFGKRLIARLVEIVHARSTVRDEVDAPLSSFVLRLYELETLAYFVAGLVDEGITVLLDVETLILQSLALNILEEGAALARKLAGPDLFTDAQLLSQVQGAEAVLATEFERSGLETQIAMAVLTAWAVAKKPSRRTSAVRLFERISSGTATDGLFRTSKLTHFVAEHAHPSLQNSCQELEYTMTRIDMLIERLILEQGKRIAHDSSTLASVATAVTNCTLMAVMIGRASRSKAIGLRNCDQEIAYTQLLTLGKSRETLMLVENLLNQMKFVFVAADRVPAHDVLEARKYSIESPVEKNW